MLTATVDGLVERYGLEGPGAVGELVAGAVLKHSRDYNLARETVLGSKLDARTPAYDIQQACGTGLQAVVAAANKITLGQTESAIVGGADTASDAPLGVNDELRRILLEVRRAKSPGARLRALARVRPPTWSPTFPQRRAAHGSVHGGARRRDGPRVGVTREAQDELAAASHQRLAAAYERGLFDDLVVPFRGLTRDQNLRPDSTPAELAALKPVFGTEQPHPTMTAGNSTPLTDGAATVLLASDDWAEARGLAPLAHLTAYETAAVDFVEGDVVGGEDGLLMAPRTPSPPPGTRRTLLGTSTSSRSTRHSPPRSSPPWPPGRSAAWARSTAPASTSRAPPRHRPPLRRHRRPHRGHPGHTPRGTRHPGRGLISSARQAARESRPSWNATDDGALQCRPPRRF